MYITKTLFEIKWKLSTDKLTECISDRLTECISDRLKLNDTQISMYYLLPKLPNLTLILWQKFKKGSIIDVFLHIKPLVKSV